MRRATGPALAEFSFGSHLRDDLPQAALCRLARETSQRNAARGVTGEMRFEDHRLQQVIEGPCDTILMLASEILADHRHERIEVRGLGAIEARRYAGWNVRGIDAPVAFCALRVEARPEPAAPAGDAWLPACEGTADRRA